MKLKWLTVLPLLLCLFMFMSTASATEKPLFLECVDCHQIGVLSMSYNQPASSMLFKSERPRGIIALWHYKAPIESAYLVNSAVMIAKTSQEPGRSTQAYAKTYIATSQIDADNGVEGGFTFALYYGKNQMFC